MAGAHMPLETAGRLGLALAMAVFMGLAFEGVYKLEPRTVPGGIRTFPLLTVLGALLYLIAAPSFLLFAVGLAAVALCLYALYRRSDDPGGERPTLVTATANLIAYALGPVALILPPWILVAAAVASVLLIESRERLHRLVRRVPADEVLTLGKFLILVGVILPLLPNRPVVSWTPITPFQVWLALVAISTLSYLSYLLQRYRPSGGALVSSILGGAYSSTATTVALARLQRGFKEARPDLMVGIVVATAVMYLRIDIVVALFNHRLAWILLPPLLALSALTAGIAAWQWWRRGAGARPSSQKLPVMNPLQLPAAGTFALLFVIVALVATWVRAHFGRPGIFGLATVSGVTDIDPFVLNLAQGSVVGMSLGGTAAAILIAASSNNVLKAVYALAFGDRRACLRPALALLATALAGVGLALFYLG